MPYALYDAQPKPSWGMCSLPPMYKDELELVPAGEWSHTEEDGPLVVAKRCLNADLT